MVDSLNHRGPDENGTYTDDDRVSIGHTRLSILDLTETGRQPMASEDGKVVLSYNGEIYNFREVRRLLQERGHQFRGTSDTEVLLRGYVEWGEDVFPRLNGMWAACIYDKERGKLILSRDRIGVKPLYYTTSGRGLAFASEVVALLPLLARRRVNPEAVDMLLSSQFIPSPMTIYEGVSKLEPRQLLVYDLALRRAERRMYYELPRYDPLRDRSRLIEEGRALLRDAVRIRMVSDVPLGAFLSGGMDSTAVVASMREHVAGPELHTVSAGFDLPGLDETPFIEIARDAYETAHHHIHFTRDDVGPALEQSVAAYSEPVADPSSLPTYRVCEEARKWMTVALSGDGADEVFGGYGSRMVVKRLATIKRAPAIVRRSLHALLRRTVGYDLSTLGKLTEALRVSLRAPRDYFAELGATCVYRPEAFKRWARQRLGELLPLAGGDLLQAMFMFDLHYNRLGDNYCAKVDRMSMAHSLEVRSPFLDYRFAEFAARIPVEWKLSGGRTKILMRDIVAGLIPAAILSREKHGFAAPLGVWADDREAELREAVEVLFRDEVIGTEWRRFFTETVFSNPHPIYREYRKRLAFLWRWYCRWVRDAEPGDDAPPPGPLRNSRATSSGGASRG
jgi:asparagine synthase (glutamine-hydrolysing)